MIVSDDGVELESESDQSNEELESGDARESDNESAGSDVVASETENNDNETETGAEDDDKITEVVGGSGFAAVDVDKVREEIEKGRAVRDQISEYYIVCQGVTRCHTVLYRAMGWATGRPNQAPQVSKPHQLSTTIITASCLHCCWRR